MEISQLKKEIKYFIQNYTFKQSVSTQNDPKAVEADLLWDASRFWATLIHKAYLTGEKMTYSGFLDFKSQYEAENNITINANDLFDRFWLRNVLGFIEIPGGINTLCHTFEKIAKLKEEFKFLNYLYFSKSEEIKKIEKNQIQPILENYNKTNATNITIDNIWGLKEFDIKNDILKLDNFEHYYSPFLTYWDDFQFILDLKNKYSSGNKELKILKKDFELIYNNFAQLLAIPTIESFKKQEVIRSISDDAYSINFYNTKIDYGCLWDKIAGLYWEILLNDFSFKSDRERVLSYLSKILHREGYPDSLRYCSEKGKKRFLNEAFNLIEKESDLKGVENETDKVRRDLYDIHGIYEITSERIIDDYVFDNSDLYELYNGISKLEHSARITFLHEQRSREWIFYLLWIIIKNDFEIENEEGSTKGGKQTYISHYKRINKLLLASIERPSLLGVIVSNITHHRREIIPYLLTDPNLISLSFQIIDRFTFLKEEQEALSNKLWTKCLQLSLRTISSLNDKSVSSKLIFQIFRQINRHKYEINNNSKIVEIEFIKRERLLLDLIEKSTNNNHAIYSRTNEEFLLPTMLKELGELWKCYI